MKRFAILICLGLLLAACGAGATTPDPGLIQLQTPKPVILDTDMAHDDMFAALFLLSHPSVDLRAITVSGTGEAHCEPGVHHALGLVALSGRKGMPVACGRETPLAGDHEFPAAWRKAVDEAYGVSIPAGEAASSLSAAELMIDTIQAADEPVTIIVIGPLTNLAEAIRSEPEITGNIKEIYIMGGAVDVEGNVGTSGAGIQNRYAEWNIYIDPVAANIVFRSGVPITLVPLDATREVPVTRAFYKALEKNRNTPAADLVYRLLTANLDFVDSGGFQFWDSLTSAISTDPGIATFKGMRLVVVEDEGPQSGRTMGSPDGAMVKVAMSARRRAFETILLTVLNRGNQR